MDDGRKGKTEKFIIKKWTDELNEKEKKEV